MRESKHGGERQAGEPLFCPNSKCVRSREAGGPGFKRKDHLRQHLPRCKAPEAAGRGDEDPSGSASGGGGSPEPRGASMADNTVPVRQLEDAFRPDAHHITGSVYVQSGDGVQPPVQVSRAGARATGNEQLELSLHCPASTVAPGDHDDILTWLVQWHDATQREIEAKEKELEELRAKIAVYASDRGGTEVQAVPKSLNKP